MKHRRFWIRFDWWMGWAFSFVGGSLFVASAIAMLTHYETRWLVQLAIGVGFILIGLLTFRFRQIWLEMPDIALDQQREEMVRASHEWVQASRDVAEHVMECKICRSDPLMALGSYSEKSPQCLQRSRLEQRMEHLRIKKQGLIDAFPWSR